MTIQYLHLCYSRSENKDYRWIFLPSFVDKSESALLKGIFDTLIDHIQLIDNTIPPIFLFNFKSAKVLLKFGSINQKDYTGRLIYAFQGIAVQKHSRREMMFVLPWLLTNLQYKLDPIQQHEDFGSLDKFNKSQPDPEELSLDDLDKIPVDSLDNSIDDRVINLGNNQIVLDYSVEGYANLVNYYINNPRVLSEFAFGYPSIIKDYFRDFSIIAPFSKQGKSRTNSEGYKKQTLISKLYNQNTTNSMDINQIAPNVNKEENAIIENETCEIKILRKSFDQKYFQERGLEIVAINGKGKIIKRISINYPENQLQLIEEDATKESLDALNQLISDLQADGWREILKKRNSWWDYKFIMKNQ